MDVAAWHWMGRLELGSPAFNPLKFASSSSLDSIPSSPSSSYSLFPASIGIRNSVGSPFKRCLKQSCSSVRAMSSSSSAASSLLLPDREWRRAVHLHYSVFSVLYSYCTEVKTLFKRLGVQPLVIELDELGPQGPQLQKYELSEQEETTVDAESYEALAEAVYEYGKGNNRKALELLGPNFEAADYELAGFLSFPTGDPNRYTGGSGLGFGSGDGGYSPLSGFAVRIRMTGRGFR
ncbi:Thioredoxin-like fold protein [Raphanus sativus]|nr:Thioredoxin-like fold protein [Raphanus sativus]